MADPLEATRRRTASQIIAIGSAAIGAVSALASGKFGYEHAKSLYDVATGSAAGFNDLYTVGDAAWAGLPIAAIFGALVLAIGFRVPLSAVTLRWLGAVGVAALWIGAEVDPPTHLAALHAVTHSGARDTPSLLRVFFEVYGVVAGICAAIAGASIGWAAVQLTGPDAPA